MSVILLFHHAQGLTSGCLSFGDHLRSQGHTVHMPDLYEGRTFTNLDDGVAHAEEIGFQTIIERGSVLAQSLPNDIVYSGFSLGVLPAQKLAQTRPGAKGAMLFHSCIRTSEFGVPWPSEVLLQIHTMQDDSWGEVDVARQIAEEVEGAQVFIYPGDRHLFSDASLPDYDEQAATLLIERVLAFLKDIG